MTNGDVAVNREGVSEYFSLQPNGQFAPEAGDQGTKLLKTVASQLLGTLLETGPVYQLVEPDGTIYQFSINGSLNYVQDPHGNRITAGYNVQGQLVSLTQSNGEYIHFAYNGQGHLSSLTDSAGQTETYGYDATGQYLTSYTDVYGTTNYTYVTGSAPAMNNALAEISYADNTHIYFTYDPQGRLIDQHRDGGAEDQKAFTYLAGGNGYVTTDGDANSTTTLFDRYGATAETIDGLKNVTHYYYDSNPNLTSVVARMALSIPTPMILAATRRAPRTRSAAPRRSRTTPQTT